MANVPTFVDGGDEPARKNIYYHSGLDIGGAEGMVNVVAACYESSEHGATPIPTC